MVEFLLYMEGEVPELSAVWGVIWEKVPENFFFLGERKTSGLVGLLLEGVVALDTKRFFHRLYSRRWPTTCH